MGDSRGLMGKKIYFKLKPKGLVGSQDFFVCPLRPMGSLSGGHNVGGLYHPVHLKLNGFTR